MGLWLSLQRYSVCNYNEWITLILYNTNEYVVKIVCLVNLHYLLNFKNNHYCRSYVIYITNLATNILFSAIMFSVTSDIKIQYVLLMVSISQ